MYMWYYTHLLFSTPFLASYYAIIAGMQCVYRQREVISGRDIHVFCG